MATRTLFPSSLWGEGSPLAIHTPVLSLSRWIEISLKLRVKGSFVLSFLLILVSVTQKWLQKSCWRAPSVVSVGLGVFLPWRYRFYVVSAIVSQVQAECKRTEAQCKQRRIKQHSTEATHPSLLLVGGTSPVSVEMFVTAAVSFLVRKHNRWLWEALLRPQGTGSQESLDDFTLAVVTLILSLRHELRWKWVPGPLPQTQML